MFTGAYRVRVDEKGRLAIPAAFRKQLPEGSYVSLGLDAVLAIYSMASALNVSSHFSAATSAA